MTELLVVLVAAFLVIAASTVLAPRLGLASPLLLVAVGVGASFLPVFSSVQIQPEWILEGILPPLLYSSAVSMPAMNFRREFGAISGLSVLLVVGTSLVLGVFFMLVLPGLGFAWGVALGAIVSPTDAVATSIIKGTSVSKRVVAILDGESLLNDASALVLLRTAIVAAAAAFSFWGAIGTFAYSVVVALVIGLVVGWLNLVVRKRVTDPTVNTVISFTVPFIASMPAELLGASGLVAAVVAGIVTGIRAPRLLSPRNRLSDTQNWRMIELVLEGAVFLTMGLQIKSIVESVERDHAGVGVPVLIAIGALVLTIVVRAAYVAPLLWSLRRRARRGEKMQGRLKGLQQNIDTPEGKQQALEQMGVGRRGTSEARSDAAEQDRDAAVQDRDAAERHRNNPERRRNTPEHGDAVELRTPPEQRRNAPKQGDAVSRLTRSEQDLERFAKRITRVLADIDYFTREPLGWREGTAIVWAGMRGAVTVAAAQTLSVNTPQHSVLVLIAFVVATLSLLVQGGTIGPLLTLISPKPDPDASDPVADEEWTGLMHLMRDASTSVPKPEGPAGAERTRESMIAERDYRLAVIEAQRAALLDARDNGTFDADLLENALANLDAAQLAMELRGKRS